MSEMTVYLSYLHARDLAEQLLRLDIITRTGKGDPYGTCAADVKRSLGLVARQMAVLFAELEETNVTPFDVAQMIRDAKATGRISS